jgi:hypothetical protein
MIEVGTSFEARAACFFQTDPLHARTLVHLFQPVFSLLQTTAKSHVDRQACSESSWHGKVDLMTRNNLADQVAWLLRNTSLSRPTILSFPNNSDLSSSGLSQSSSRKFTRDSEANRQSGPESQSLSSSDTISQPLYPTLPSARSLTTARHAITPGESLEEGNMGRLTSASKSKKPSLVSRQQSSSASQTRETGKPAVQIHDDITLSTGGFTDPIV